jgi:ectoine hydroxylase-related dioxygenase (phytanoyl-CoA dioxygenase family)
MKLDAAQIAQFEEEGYLLLHGVLTDADLDPVIAEYEQHIDRRAHELLTEGKISKLYADEPFHRRLVSICRECDEIYSNLDIMHFRGRDSFEFLRNDHLLDIVEGLVGPEITCSPVQHTRAKLPQGLTPSDGDPHIAPWHQDAGAFVEAADPHFVLTVWLPLSEARPENGCMQIIPRVHTEGLQQHWIERGLVTMSVEDERLREEGLTMPMDKGDVLLMHKAVPHRSTPNNTDTVRWSMDLRYQQTGTPSARPAQPDVAVRSRCNPSSVLSDYDEWCRLWIEALEGRKVNKRSAPRWVVR